MIFSYLLLVGGRPDRNPSQRPLRCLWTEIDALQQTSLDNRYATYEKTVLGYKQFIKHFGLLVHERNYQMAYVLLDTSAFL